MLTREYSVPLPSLALRSLLCVAAFCLALAPPAEAAGGVPPELPSGDLQGVVYDADGLPLIGALVNVLTPGSEGPPAAITVTDDRGHFVLPNLPDGVYTLMARSVGFVQAVMPGVVVPRQEPVNLQLRPEPSLALLSTDSTLDLGWAFRPRVRDVLRKREGLAGPDTSEPRSPRSEWDWLASAARSLGIDDLGGELSVWAVAPFRGAEGDRGSSASSTDVSLGARRDQQSWILRAQVGDGGLVRAVSRVSQTVGDDHMVRFGFGFAGKDLSTSRPGLPEEAQRMWVGSIAGEHVMRFGERMTITPGVRFEHYNYLEEAGVISPRIEVTYAPVESMVLSAAVSYDAEAPGLAELRFEIDPLNLRYMDILTPEGLAPERTTRYSFGVQRTTGETEVRARAFYDDSSQELLSLYAANSTGPGEYVAANAGDAVTRGFQVDVRRTFLDTLASQLSYSYGRRTGDTTAAGVAAGVALRKGLLSPDNEMELGDIESFHELEAAVETVLDGTDTRLRATYRWQLGLPVIRDGALGDVYDRLDVRVRQPLPFRMLASEWAALVRVQNIFGQEYDGVFDLSMDEVPVLSRLVAGGLAVRF